MVGQCGFHYKEIGMQPMNNDDHEYIGVSENGMYHQMDPNGNLFLQTNMMIHWTLTNQYMMIHAAVQMESGTSSVT
jgi:hypothetical protein